MSVRMMIAASLATAMLAGCGGAEDKQDTAAGTAAASDSGSMPADWKATDACSIIDKAEMGEVMKSSVTETALSLVNEPNGPNAATSECSYILADGGRASVMTRWSPIADNTAESMAATRSTVAASMKPFTDLPIEDVPGVGKAAFLVPKIHQFNVFLDERRMIIITIGSAPDAEAKDRAIALAKKAGA